MKTKIFIIGLFISFLIALFVFFINHLVSKLATKSKSDKDKESNECLHLHITDVVEEAFSDYEIVGTYCFECGERLSSRQDGY